MPLAVGPEPLVAIRVPTADPVHSTEPRAVDSPRSAVEEPATELSGPPTEQPPPPADPAIPADYPQLPPAPRRGRSWVAMLALLAIGLCGFAGGAAGAVRQLLPREFSLAQQRQIQTWEMTRRWRAQQAGQIFPATLPLPGAGAVPEQQRRPRRSPLADWASRRRVAAAGSYPNRPRPCSRPADCAAVLRATYLDASGAWSRRSASPPCRATAAALAAVAELGVSARSQSFAVHAFPLARSAAASFRQAQRQYSIAMSSRAVRHPRDGGIHRRQAARAAVHR